MMDKISPQPSRCNLPSLPALNVNLFTRISLFLFIIFYSRKKGFCIFEWWRTQSHYLNYITYFETSYLKVLVQLQHFVYLQTCSDYKIQGLWRWGCSVKQGCRFVGRRLSHTICNIRFANILTLTYKHSQCTFTFKFIQSQALQFLVCNRWIKKGTAESIKADSAPIYILRDSALGFSV